jgi:hypothetical protein
VTIQIENALAVPDFEAAGLDAKTYQTFGSAFLPAYLLYNISEATFGELGSSSVDFSKSRDSWPGAAWSSGYIRLSFSERVDMRFLSDERRLAESLNITRGARDTRSA